MTNDDATDDKSPRVQARPMPESTSISRPENFQSALRRLSPLRNVQPPGGPSPRPPLSDNAYVFERAEHASLIERISAGLRIGLTLVPVVSAVQVVDAQVSYPAARSETSSLSQSAALKLVFSQLSDMKQSLAAMIQRLRHGGEPASEAREMQGILARLAELSGEHRRLLEAEKREKAYEDAWGRLNEVLQEEAEEARRLTESARGEGKREKIESLLELAFALHDAIE
jgi:hypothetical protein